MTKKLLSVLMIVTLFTSMITYAQQKQIIKKKPTYKDQLSGDNANKPSSPSQVLADIITYGYIANTTHTLDLTLNFSNTDQEYADSIAITFPSGITPLGTPDFNFPTFDTDGGFCSYNGVVGQTISWGKNNNDLYGGVFGRNLHFKVAINVGSLTGVETATFHLSGDGYTQINPTSDFDGTFTIIPKIAVDLRILNFLIPPKSCLNGATERIGMKLKNEGYSTANGGVTLTYQVNTNTMVTETSNVNLAPGDTLFYVFNTFSDFSALTGYTATGTIANSLDGNLVNNSKVEFAYTFPKYTLPYTTSFENTSSDTLNWQREDNDSPNTWQLTNILPHTGTNCMRMLETSNVTSDDWLFSSCIDLQTNKEYYLRYWSRLSSGYQASLYVFLTIDNNSYAPVESTLKQTDSLFANDTWTLDSIPFTVSQSGLYFVAFEAFNNTQTTIALRLDDIKIAEATAINGVNDLVEDEISVYPNPTAGILNIYSPNSLLTIDVYNVLGQSVYSTKTDQFGANTINLSGLPQGNYTVKCSNNRNLFYRKIIIENN